MDKGRIRRIGLDSCGTHRLDGMSVRCHQTLNVQATTLSSDRTIIGGSRGNTLANYLEHIGIVPGRIFVQLIHPWLKGVLTLDPNIRIERDRLQGSPRKYP